MKIVAVEAPLDQAFSPLIAATLSTIGAVWVVATVHTQQASIAGIARVQLAAQPTAAASDIYTEYAIDMF